MNETFDEKEHQKAVKMLRWLNQMEIDYLLSKQESDTSIDHHALALERCKLSLTVCKVVERLNLSTAEPQLKLRNHIDPDLPIFLNLLPGTGESLVSFPVRYKRVIACDVFDQNPLTFTVNHDKTLYEARLTPEQTKTVLKALRIEL